MSGFFQKFMLIAIGSTLFAGVAHAQDSEAQKKPERFSIKMLETMRQEALLKMDANGDGSTSVEELMSTIPLNFARIDTNKDKVISSDEVTNAMKVFSELKKPQYGAAYPNFERRYSSRFISMDVNKDGRISEQEFTSYYKQRYGLFDRNKDGAISAKEFCFDEERTPYAN